MKPHTRPSRRVQLEPGALRRVREEAGLSIRGLATSSGVSYSHIAAIERGEDGVSAPRLAMLAAALGCTIADLRKPDVAAHA